MLNSQESNVYIGLSSNIDFVNKKKPAQFLLGIRREFRMHLKTVS